MRRLPQPLLLFSIAFLLIVSTVVAVGSLYFYRSYQRIVVTPIVPAPTPVPTLTPHIDAFNQLQPYSLLLLGYGGGTHEGGKLTDSMLLVHIVPQTQQVFLISLPRDLWIALPSEASNSSYWKINAAYAIGADDRRYPHKPVQFTGAAGGGQLAKYAVTLLTGMTVDNFVALDFSGFEKTINTLGGVDTKVERTLDDPQYPLEGKETDTCGKSPTEMQAISATLSATLIETDRIYDCRYEHLHFDPGVVHMDGATALKYVRSRHAAQDGGDFNRAQRQRNLLLAVKQRLLSINFLPKAIPFLSSLPSDLQTDIDLVRLQEFLQYAPKLSTYTITSLALTDQNILTQTHSTNGQDILIPKAGIDRFDTVQLWLREQMQASGSATAH